MNIDIAPSIKTLYLLDDPSKDKHVHNHLLKALSEAGFNPVIGYFYGNSRDSVMATDKIRAVSLGLSKSQFRGFSPSTISKLRRLISRESFSLIHCQRHRALVNAGFAISGTSANTLFYTVRATNVLRNWNRRVVFNYLARRINKVICVSSAVKDYMLKMAPVLSEDKVLIIHNGVDINDFDIEITREEARRWLGIPEDGFYFGIVARLKKAKCHDILLKSFARLLRQIPATRLAIVGDGPLEDVLRGLSIELGISDKVFFTGRVEYHEVAKTMKAFDCFVHPSFREGLGVAILEAMASSLPVIATSADGIRDIYHVKDCIGEMIMPMDVEALANSMIRFRKMDTKHLQRIGRTARKHIVDHFSKDLMVSRNLALYEAVKMQ